MSEHWDRIREDLDAMRELADIGERASCLPARARVLHNMTVRLVALSSAISSAVNDAVDEGAPKN